MTSTSAEFAISGMMLLVGSLTFVLSRSPRIGVLLRPLSWSLGLFGLGIWALFGIPLAGTRSHVVPLAMILSILWGIRTERAPVTIAARKLAVRFVAIGFLVLMGITTDLAILFFAAEAACLSMLAEHAWDSPLPVCRRNILARSVGSLFLLGSGVTLIASFTGTTSLDSIEAHLSDRWQQTGLLMQDTPAGAEFIRAGLILLLTGAAWRLSFFPFALSRNGEWSETISGDSQVVRIFSISVLLSIVIPRLESELEASQILLVTFGLTSFVRGTIRAIRSDFLENSIRELLNASAALIWIVLAVGLQGSVAGRAESEGFRFPGEEILIFELKCGLVTFLLLGLMIERQSVGLSELVRREQLIGMIQRTPVSAGLTLFLWLLWTGLFALHGRWVLLFDGFRIAASNDSAAAGYFLVSTVLLLCVGLQQLLALQLCQMICSRGWLSRTVSARNQMQDFKAPLSSQPIVVQD